MTSTKYGMTWVGVICAVALAGACGSKTAATCAAGTERCPCYPNQTCDVGLSCLSSVCVSEEAGVGGNGGSGLGIGGSTLGTGGSTLGTGGSTLGTGGSTTATGGSTGSNTNMIKNGDFSQGKEYWDLTFQAGEIESDTYSGGEYCIYNESDALYLSFSLGYPPTPSDAFVIDPAATYTLSYDAIGTYSVLTPTTIMVKIGHVESPYTEAYSTTDYVTSTDPQTFTHQVSSTVGDTGAGLVFNVTLDYYPAEVCFDNVSLIKN